MARSLREKNALDCNVRARAKYNAGYLKKMELKGVSVRLKKDLFEKVDMYCTSNGISKNELINELLEDFLSSHG